jgi:hypothetical protein
VDLVPEVLTAVVWMELEWMELEPVVEVGGMEEAAGDG